MLVAGGMKRETGKGEKRKMGNEKRKLEEGKPHLTMTIDSTSGR